MEYINEADKKRAEQERIKVAEMRKKVDDKIRNIQRSVTAVYRGREQTNLKRIRNDMDLRIAQLDRLRRLPTPHQLRNNWQKNLEVAQKLQAKGISPYNVPQGQVRQMMVNQNKFMQEAKWKEGAFAGKPKVDIQKLNKELMQINQSWNREKLQKALDKKSPFNFPVKKIYWLS